jgi:7-keto-8-aminopelargonate synthetase-like enzyme
MRKGLTDIGYDTGDSVTPIIPLVVGESRRTIKFFKKLFEHKPRGIFTNPVVHPATPKGRELIRTSYIATMSDEVTSEALEIFEEAGKDMKLI